MKSATSSPLSTGVSRFWLEITFSFIFLRWRQYVSEHDEAVQAGKSEEVTRVTVSVIHDNEAKVEALVQTAATASEELADAKAGGIVLT